MSDCASQTQGIAYQVSLSRPRPEPVRRNSAQSNRICILEAARGFAAVYVMVGHVFLAADASGRWPQLLYFFRLFGFGHQAVILFFLISGFSIHYSSFSRPLATLKGCSHYYYLRFRRIYPLFLISLLLAFGLFLLGRALGFEQYRAISVNAHEFLVNALFLTNLEQAGTWFSTTHLNPPLWSLSYEVPYYLLYPVFWRLARARGVQVAFLAGAVVSGLSLLLDRIGLPSHLGNVFALYWIWCLGALIGEWRLTNKVITCPSPAYCAGVMALFTCTIFVERVSEKFLDDWCWGALLGAIMLSYQVQFKHPKRQPTQLSGALLPVVAIGFGGWILCDLLGIPGSRGFFRARLLLAGVLLGGMILRPGPLGIRKLCSVVLIPFLGFGMSSYALYICHWPLLSFAKQLGLAVGLGSGLMLPLLFATAGVTLVVGWLLERRVQPTVAAAMDRGRHALERRRLP